MIILGYEISQVTYTRYKAYIISLTNLSQIIGTLSTYLGYSNWQLTIEMPLMAIEMLMQSAYLS